MAQQHLVPTPLAEGKNTKEAIENLRTAIERTIQAEVDQGWRYVGQVESITFQNPGCIAAFLGAKPVPMPTKFLLFEK